MNLIVTAFLFSFVISCWPKTNIVNGLELQATTSLNLNI